MEKRSLSKLFSSVQREISLLKKDIKKAKIRHTNLKRQALTHIVDVFPEEYKRIVGDVPKLQAHNKSIENIFYDMNTTQKSILGCSLNVKGWSAEYSEDSLKKDWIVEGKLAASSLSFIAEYTTTDTENAAPEIKTELLEIQKLDIFPQSEELESLATHIIQWDALETLIPSLYMFQKIQDERSEVEEILSSIIEVETFEENNVLNILVDLDTHKLKIDWSFHFSDRGSRFIHNISVLAGDEIKTKYKSTNNINNILSGEDILSNADEVLAFIEALFKDDRGED